MTNLIIGCGYLGIRVASLWQGQGKRVIALTRGRADELRRLGLEPLLGDVAGTLPVLPVVDTVLYAVGMDRASGRSFRDVYVNGLSNVLDHLPSPRRFIYVSSTSVYSQANGEEVDEMSSAVPLEENGRVILAAESLLCSRLPEAIILRFAGIYGPGRIIRRKAIEQGEPLQGDADKWLNLIHVEDGARAAVAAGERGQPGETYLVSDGNPVRRRDFYTFMADLLKAPPARFEPLPAGATIPNHERANRRITNRKMLEELGVTLEFGDYRQGLRGL